MKFGLREKDLEILKKCLASFINVGGEIYIFGSRSREKFQKYSDIDLLLRGPIGFYFLHYFTYCLIVFELFLFVPYRFYY